MVRSPPDDLSPLDGLGLVAKQVKRLEVMVATMQTAGKPKPTHLQFNTLHYNDAGMCRVMQSGERNMAGVWRDKGATSWIQFQYVDGRQRLVTSYAVEFSNQYLLPKGFELSGSNDGSLQLCDEPRVISYHESRDRLAPGR